MPDVSPYEPTSTEIPSTPQPSRPLKRLGTAILAIGATVLLYGVTAFWLITSLPPNTTSSRLPSLMVLAVGGFLSLLGLAIQSAGTPKKEQSKGIPTSVGLFILFAVVVGMISVFIMRAR